MFIPLPLVYERAGGTTRPIVTIIDRLAPKAIHGAPNSVTLPFCQQRKGFLDCTLCVCEYAVAVGEVERLEGFAGFAGKVVVWKLELTAGIGDEGVVVWPGGVGDAGREEEEWGGEEEGEVGEELEWAHFRWGFVEWERIAGGEWSWM